MYCTNCGEEVAENAVICIKCGVAKGTEKKFCYSCGAAINENQVVCVKCGVSLAPQAQPKKTTSTKTANSSTTSSVAYGVKNRVTAGVLALLLGSFGAHKFYLGKTVPAIIMLACGILGWVLMCIPTFLIGIIALIEGIKYLCMTDEEFYNTYIVDDKNWF